MKKSLQKILICCLVLCMCVTATAISALAAADDTYVVSFRPGEHGSFSDEAVSYLEGFGTVAKSASGNLFVEVKAGTDFPIDILSYLTIDDGYYYKEGFLGNTITEDATYVAQYGILHGSGIIYTVKYVDSVSGAELANSYTGYANYGDVIPFAAKTVKGYDVDSDAKSVTVKENAEIKFLYTSNGELDEIQYQYGEDTVITKTVTSAAAPTAITITENDQTGNDSGKEAIEESEAMVDNSGVNIAEEAQTNKYTPLKAVQQDVVPINLVSCKTDTAAVTENNATWETVAAVSILGIVAIVASAVFAVIHIRHKG